MLESIHLKNFKSFADAEVKLAPVTVLVGANASGKSNLLDALRFVQRLELGWTLTEALQGKREAGREVAPPLRGGTKGFSRLPSEPVELGLSWRLGNSTLVHDMGIEARGTPTFRWERLVIEGKPRLIFNAIPTEDRIAVMMPDWLRSKTVQPEEDGTEGIYQLADQSIYRLARGRLLGRFSPDTPVFSAPTLGDSLFLGVVPARMRGYSPQQSMELGAEGENVSSVLWFMFEKNRDAKQEWIDWLAELCAPEIVGLEFSGTELDDVMLVIVERDGTRTPARSLSDGTLRFLGTLVGLRTVKEGSIVMLEEPETGLHPQRIHLLVEYLEAVSRERNLQIILTTHSPQVLQALSPEALKNTVLCARSPELEGTVLRRLGDLPHFEEVSQRSNIEHLFTTGWLERAL